MEELSTLDLVEGWEVPGMGSVLAQELGTRSSSGSGDPRLAVELQSISALPVDVPVLQSAVVRVEESVMCNLGAAPSSLQKLNLARWCRWWAAWGIVLNGGRVSHWA